MTDLMDQCNIKDKSVDNMSIEMKSVNSKEGKEAEVQDQNYNWSGSGMNKERNNGTGWSYKAYMEEKEAEENRRRKKKFRSTNGVVQVITIDD